MSPANLLHLTLSMGAGGIENLIMTMARHIDNQRFTMSVGCLDSGGVLLQEISSLGCNTFVLSRRGGFDFRLILQLAKILRERKIHILHTHNQAAHFYGCLAGKLARTPVIINTEHSRHYIDGHWRRRLEKKGLSFFTDKIVTVSQELRQQSLVRDKIAEKKLEVVLNGIDLSFYNSSGSLQNCSVSENLRQELGIPKSSKVVGIIGRLHPVKNHELLFRSLRHIVFEKQIAVSLLVVGDGELRKTLEDLAESLDIVDNVHFAGYRQDIPQIMTLLDVLVLCSHSEGLPLTLLEAMAAGVPVVVTEGANKSKLVRHCKNGLVADATVESLATMIVDSLDVQVSEKFIPSARELVFRKYSILTTIDRYQGLYDQLLYKL